MISEWREFWKNYRNREVHSEGDLYFQVGKTIEGRPIREDVFRMMVKRIVRGLELQLDDHLLDMCCGNGLITRQLAPHVERVTAVDFAHHLILAAKTHGALQNIEYIEGDAVDGLSAVRATPPTKFLMNDSLAYFDPKSFARLLAAIVETRPLGPVRVLITGIPDDDRKWVFYDTPERRLRYDEGLASGSGHNDGLGRWWRADEIRETCERCGLHVQLEAQPVEVSTYRMDALIMRV